MSEFIFRFDNELVAQMPLAEVKRLFLHAYVQHCYELFDKRKRRTARVLKVDSKTIYRILKKKFKV